MNTQQLTMVLSAIDRASPVLKTVAGSLHTVARAAEAVLGAFRRLAAGGLDLARGLLTGVVGVFQRIIGIATRLAGVLGGVLLAGLVAVGRAGVDMQTTLERASLSLTKITGSATGAARLLAEVRKESLTSSLTFKEMIPIAQQLAAAYGPAGIGRVIPTLRAFGDTASALGADREAQGRALLGFRQLLTRDKPTQEDLNQVSENLPGLNVRDILRRRLGSADTETLNDAGITGRQVAEALVAGMEQGFGGSQTALANTLPTILSNFTDAWNNLTAAVVARFTPALTAALGKVLAVVQGLAGNERLISALAVPFDLLAAVITKAADALPGFVTWLEGVLTRENVIQVLAGIGGAIKTIWDEAMRLIDAVSGGKGLIGIWETFQAVATTAIDFVLRAWNALVAGIEYLAANAPALWGVVQTAINNVQTAVESLVGAATVLLGILAADKIAGIVGGLLGVAGGVLTVVNAVRALFTGGAAAGAAAGAAGAAGSAAAGAAGAAGAGAAAGGAAVGGGTIAAGAAALAVGGAAGWFIQDFFDLWGNKKAQQRADEANAWSAKQAKLQAEELRRRGLEVGPDGKLRPAQSPLMPGPLGTVQGIGRGALGAAGNLVNQGIGALPAGVRNFFGGLAGAVQGGFQSGGLGPAMGAFGQNTAQTRRTLENFLTPAKGTTDNEIPRIIMGQAQPGAGSGAVPELPDKKKLRAIEQAREAFWRAMIAQSKAYSAVLGGGEDTAVERAWIDVQTQIPALESKQADLLARMREITEKAKTDAEANKEYFDLQAEYYQAEETKAGLRERAADAEKQQGRKQRNILAKQVDLAVAAVENNPLLSQKGRGEALANVLAEKFRFLSTPQQGESEEEALDRQIQAQGVRGDIFKALGLGMKTVGLLGGGTLDIGNRGRISQVSAFLDSIAGQAGALFGGQGQTPGGTPALPGGVEAPMPEGLIAPHVQREMRMREEQEWARRNAGYSSQPLHIHVDSPPVGAFLQDPTVQRTIEQFLNELLYTWSQRANPGPSY